ncbi:MAG: cyclic nucleotide-binding domain-containing protein [Proteobacteria bacterium]|jgi:CRP/FNR family transcriptional regulator, cyclic AMP receptor protein|nr:cyclic nucleotide-binding domain-containing protein [Pseudomonadota bacterium]
MPKISSLRDSTLFKNLTDEQIGAVVNISETRAFEEDERIISEGEPGEKMYLILAGRVAITVSVPGEDRTEELATLDKGEVFGELSLLGRDKRAANVVTKTEVNLMEWNASALNSILEQDSALGFQVMRSLAYSLTERLTSTNINLRNTFTKMSPLI